MWFQPSRGISVMCSTGAQMLVVQNGMYVPYGQRSTKWQGKALFRRAAKSIYWMVFWNRNARKGHKEVMDFSDMAFEA